MNIETTLITRYHFVILQYGSLPLTPDGQYNSSVEHRCTSALLWPEHEPPSIENTVLTDPCFTAEGYQYAVDQLHELKLSLLDIGWVFTTHLHQDHCANIVYYIERSVYKHFQVGGHHRFSSLLVVPYQGHARMQRGLFFRSSANKIVCISGDAILDLEWLRAWKYYWPNFYHATEIIQTWESLADIISHTDLIIPGHGQPIHVTPELVEHLLATFTEADYANECQRVEEMLSKRLARFRAAR